MAVSNIIGKLSLTICVILTATNFQTVETANAKDPSPQNGKYVIQVPHVVLPETVQYAPYSSHRAWPYQDSGISASRSPATYTAFPSYHVSADTEFRPIGGVNYPVTPADVATVYPMGHAARIANDNRIEPTEQKISLQENHAEPNVPDWSPNFTVPEMASADLGANQIADNTPIYLKKIDESPIRLVNDTTQVNSTRTDTPQKKPADSIVFIKRDKAKADDGETPPRQLTMSSSTMSDDDPPETNYVLDIGFDRIPSWRTSQRLQWNNAIQPVSYTEVAPPTQLSLAQPGMSFQPAQPAPAYGQLCQKNYYGGYGQMTYPQQQGCFGGLHSSGAQQSNYNTGINSALNAYLSTALTQPYVSPQVQSYNSLSQLGNMMPMMSGQPGAMQAPMQMPMQVPGYAGGMQQMMTPMSYPGSMPQQQTLGYIVLYPQASQSGVNMQLTSPTTETGEEGQATGGESQSETQAATDPNAAQNTQQMVATFVPASSLPNFAGQSGMPQQQLYHGMNPYMMNPMMGMGGMNPYMMNPMMGMGGMMPPIIIQMPASDSGSRRRGGGLFARMRANREESQNRSQQASGSLSSLFSQPEHMPAKAAYPYGYFGATSLPYQAGSFGGYNDMYMQRVQYPGM